jgi:hypothetical protein
LDLFTGSSIRFIVGRFTEQNKCPIRFVKRNHSNVIVSTKTNAFEQVLHKEFMWFVWIVDSDIEFDILWELLVSLKWM